MKGTKGIIRANQRKQERNSDAEKLDQICMALADIGKNFQREVHLIFERKTGKLVFEGHNVPSKYKDQMTYQKKNCDIVVTIIPQEDAKDTAKKLYIELDGESIHGACDGEVTINKQHTRDRNLIYERAGLEWFAVNESLAKFTGFKNCWGDLSAFVVMSWIQKFVAIGDINHQNL
tara:strand:- start:3448 stop:3975 length:528 start_codon:yes stop_codon:yes gene_type:complete